MENKNESQDVGTDLDFDLLGYFRIILRRKWLIIIFALVLTVAVGVASSLQPKIYVAQSSVLVGGQSARLLGSDPIPEERFQERGDFLTQRAIIQSRSFLQRVAVRLIQKDMFGEVPEEDLEPTAYRIAQGLRSQTTVKLMQDSRMLAIQVQGRVPSRLAAIANGIAEEYVEMNLDKKDEMANQAVAWLETKLEEQRSKLKEAEAEFRSFKKRENLSETGEDDPYKMRNLARLNEDYLNTRYQRIEKESRLSALKDLRSRSDSGEGSTEIQSSLDAEVQGAVKEQLKKEYVQARVDLRELSQKYGPGHPDIITLQGRIAKISHELENFDMPEAAPPPATVTVSESQIAELEAQLSALRSKENALARTLESLKQSARNMSEQATQYTLLKQEVDLVRQTYNDLLTRLNGMKLSSQIKNPAVKILDRADAPRYPISPQPARNVSMALILGLVLGTGLAFLLEHLDRRVKSPTDVAKFLRLPLLTVVPTFDSAISSDKGKPKLVTLVQPRSHAAETYRNLRTSILFSSGRPVPKTLVVTSAVAGEGKSTTSANLAVVMAQSGRRVLLVDADLRRPAQRRYFGREEGKGIIRLLTEECQPKEAIQHSGTENLDLLLCHSTPSNPSELLGSDRALAMFDRLKTIYDLAIFDAPVIISVPDAIILASWAEAVVMVHRPGAADREMVAHARSKLQEVHANLLGLTINNVSMKSGQYLYPEYMYYGYGTETEKKGSKKTGKGRV